MAGLAVLAAGLLWPLSAAEATTEAPHDSIFTATCPGPSCPYTPPTAAEQGFANDVLARINLERTAPARDYVDNGHTVVLPALPMDPTLEETAQAAAEYLAANQVLEDYSGVLPNGYYGTGGNALTGGGAADDSASVDDGIMHSPGHAGAILSAADDFAGIGVAFDANGFLGVIELFADSDKATAQVGQARLAAQFASDGVMQTEDGATFRGFPTQPILAGTGGSAYPLASPAVQDTSGKFATGVDWTSAGPSYPPGPAMEAGAVLAGPAVAMATSSDGGGYVLADSVGTVSHHGDATFWGDVSENEQLLNQPIVGMATLPDGRGYWEVASDGGIFTFGYAGYYGSTGAERLNKPIVGMASTPDGKGYWLVASDGGIFTFGDAQYYGSTGAEVLNKPIVGMAATPSGKGYWLVASDGGIFTFGDAAFYGSTGAEVLNKPIVGMAATPSGKGYWLVASDGGIFTFGDAAFYGSTGAEKLNKPVVGMAATHDGRGYWLVASDGGIFTFGDAPYLGAD